MRDCIIDVALIRVRQISLMRSQTTSRKPCSSDCSSIFTAAAATKWCQPSFLRAS